jgi:uncharacterized protein YcfJ
MTRCALILAGLLLLPGVGLAQNRPIGENVTYGYAQVLRASAVYQTVRVRVPEQRCEGQSRDGGDPTGGTVAGAVVGGAIGHQVGKGDGRRASTVAGAVIGGTIGRRIDKNNGRCRTVEVTQEERRLIGYDVEYQYKGEKYMSRLQQDPGNRLRIRIAVTPDELALGDR